MKEKKQTNIANAFFKYLVIFILGITISGCNLDSGNTSINEKTVDDIISRAKPIIEEVTGREFKTDIKYKILNRSEFQDILKEDMIKGIREWQKEPGLDMVKRQMEMSAQLRSQYYIARHLHRKQVIYIIKNNIKPVKELYEISDEDLSDFLSIIIAHEMVHGLDNQYYDLVKFLSESKNQEDNYARGAVIGGSAAIITKKIADRMNIPERIYKFSLMLDICMKDESDPRANEIYNLYYVKGAEFIQAILDKKGIAEYGSTFQSPPDSTRQIYHPEEYLGQTALPVVDCEELVKKVSVALPKKAGMRSQTTVIGTAAIKGVLVNEGISEEDATFIGNNCMSAASQSSILQSLDQYITTLSVMNFKNKDAAVKYSDIMELIAHSKDDQQKAKLNTTLTIIKDKELDIAGYHSVRLKKAELKVDTKTISKMVVTGILDNLYVAIENINMDESTEEKIINVFNMIYAEQLKMKQI